MKKVYKFIWELLKINISICCYFANTAFGTVCPKKDIYKDE